MEKLAIDQVRCIKMCCRYRALLMAVCVVIRSVVYLGLGMLTAWSVNDNSRKITLNSRQNYQLHMQDHKTQDKKKNIIEIKQSSWSLGTHH